MDRRAPSCVPDLPNDSRNDGTDLGRREQTLQHRTQAIDNAVLNLELSTCGAQLHLFEPLLVLNIHPKLAIVIPHRNDRVLRIESPFETKDLLGCLREVSDIGNCDVA